MAKKTNVEKKKMNPLLWFLFAIIIPIIIVITLLIIILNIAGFNITDWAKEKGNDVPVLSNVITTEEEASVEKKEQQFEETISSKNEEIAGLQQNVSDLEATITNLNDKITELENSEQTMPDSADERKDLVQVNDEVKMVAKSYEEMDSKQAAQILENLNRGSAIIIIKEVANEVRGAILEEMNPEVAAEITESLLTAEN